MKILFSPHTSSEATQPIPTTFASLTAEQITFLQSQADAAQAIRTLPQIATPSIFTKPTFLIESVALSNHNTDLTSADIKPHSVDLASKVLKPSPVTMPSTTVVSLPRSLDQSHLTRPKATPTTSTANKKQPTVTSVQHPASKLFSANNIPTSQPPLPHKKFIMGKIEHNVALETQALHQHAQNLLQLSQQEPLLHHHHHHQQQQQQQQQIQNHQQLHSQHQQHVMKTPDSSVGFYAEIDHSQPRVTPTTHCAMSTTNSKMPQELEADVKVNPSEGRLYITSDSAAQLYIQPGEATHQQHQQYAATLAQARIFPKDEPMSPRSLASSPIASGSASPRSPMNSSFGAAEFNQRLAPKGLLLQQHQLQQQQQQLQQQQQQQQVVISPAETLVISTSAVESDDFVVSSASSPTSTVPPTSQNPDIPQTKIPGTTVYEGECGFRISFAPQMKETKSAQWTYSPMLHKLFTRINAACPVRFQCAYKLPPSGTILRALPIYMQPEHVCEPVVRCPVHVASSILETDLSSAAQGGRPMNHLIRADHPHSEYVEADPQYSRQSVCVPFEAPAVGTQWSTVLYRYMCNSSCAGGMNRRPIQTVFTLETPAGEVIGRQVVEVRICACPGRDSKVEERNVLNKGSGGDLTSSKGNGTKMEPGFILDGPLPLSSYSPPGSDLYHAHPGAGRKRRRAGGAPDASAHVHHVTSYHHDDDESGPNGGHGPDDQRVFTLLVRGRDTFDLLKRIRDSIELSKMATNEQLDRLQMMDLEMEQQVTAASSLISFMSQPPQINGSQEEGQ